MCMCYNKVFVFINQQTLFICWLQSGNCRRHLRRGQSLGQILVPHTLQEIDKAFIVAEDAYVRAQIVLHDLIRVAMIYIDSGLL